MPSPIRHALTGFALQQARPGVLLARPGHEAVLFLFLANLPDLDFLPGFLAGAPNLYHHGAFHSLGAALAVSALVGILFRLGKRSFRGAAVLMFLLYLVHLALDYFAGDTKPPYGMPLLWPFSGEFFLAPRALFLNIARSGSSRDFLSSLFNLHNLDAVLREIMLLGGPALGAWLWRRRRKRGNAKA